MPAGSPSSWGARLRFAAFVVVASALLAELALRWVAPSYAVVGDVFYAPDPELEFRLAPGYRGRFEGVGEFDTTVRVNSLGLRGDELAAGRPLLAGIGDSFMFGWGVEEEETFLARAAAASGAAPANGGVPGYAVCQATRMGMRLGEALRPSAVVLSVFTGNDEVDEMRAGTMTVADGRLLDRPRPPSRLRDLRQALYAHSHLVRRVRGAPVVGTMKQRLLGLPEPGALHLLRVLLVAYEAPPAPQLLAADARIADCLARLAAFARERALPVAVVVIPAPWELVPGGVEAMAAALERPPGDLDPEAPRRRWLGLLHDAGLTVLDLHHSLAAATARGEKLFFPHDRHLTRDGHALVAEEIRDWAAAVVAGPAVEAGASK